jgi:hypothetical protein
MVTLAEIQEQVSSLPVGDRGRLASFIIEHLPDADYDVSDEEVSERARQMRAGEVELLTWEQLRIGVMQDRDGP